MTQATPSTYAFTLILDGVSDLTQELMDAVYEAGFDDALFGISVGVPFLDLERTASSARAAVLDAIAQVKRVGHGVRVIRVEPENFVPDAELQCYCDALVAQHAS